MELEPSTCGGPYNSTRAPISNHQKFKFIHLAHGAKYFCGCFEFKALKVELALQRMVEL